MSKRNLLFQIETNRQRLEHAIRTDDFSLTIRALTILNQLYPQLLELTKAERMSVPKEEMKLVFSEAHPDGKTMSQVDYRRLCMAMSKMDLETHVAVDVPCELVDASEQALFEVASGMPVKVAK